MFDEVLAGRVRSTLSGRAAASEKRMFGGLAFLVGGHMAVAVSGHGGLMVRFPPGRTDELLAEPGTAPMVMRGREVRGWLRVESGALDDQDELSHWVDIGIACASSLPDTGQG